ncbi:hypothetical protein CKM354_000090100 [Cercospora kikuchii]|uniref:Galactose oxidase n=2 Tax=Cercospora kikuchii TaxID=84275 RepID=A0A9P3FCD8_9PEZI|nr:uncharacterized protein CKM354_000090100 [Cercospora kikuchii]GIZ37455.1 hypothetical protein CKM354_000090100 [Cercospora kikuchii]
MLPRLKNDDVVAKCPSTTYNVTTSDSATWSVCPRTVYDGNTLQFQGGLSRVDCANLCAKRTGCSRAAYLPRDSGCHLKDGKQSRWLYNSDWETIELVAKTPGGNSPKNLGNWSNSIPFPLVPAAVAALPDGRLLTWSSGLRNMHGLGQYGQTFSAYYDPKTGTVTERLVSNTNHDMFCPGISSAFDGSVVVTGGSSTKKVSVHTVGSGGGFVVAPELAIPRGYQSQVTLSDGRLFTIGGSWIRVTNNQPGSGQVGGKTGEVYDFNTKKWTVLPGCPTAPLETNDKEGLYRSDNHAWLFSWKNGSVFQAGPSKAMNWFYTNSQGRSASAGTRDNTDAMCGVFQMYDATTGSIFTAGGAPDYDQSPGINNANVITINQASGQANVRKLRGMNHPRAFANAVTLPNGQVLILGGQTYARTFTDNDAVTVPELWDPVTNNFTDLADSRIPRTYHSAAALLPDGTVFSGGGGLCDFCGSANHLDGQIFTPPYLFETDGVTPAKRPSITSIQPSVLKVGGEMTITVTSPSGSGSNPISVALLRLGSSTHSTDTDSRRVPLSGGTSVGAGATRYRLPSDPGVLLPGYYYVFAMANGVPSQASIVRVTP